MRGRFNYRYERNNHFFFSLFPLCASQELFQEIDLPLNWRRTGFDGIEFLLDVNDEIV
jgi:hypothetical protein